MAYDYSKLGTAWIVPVIVIVVIVVGAISWIGQSSNTTGKGSAVDSRSTTGSNTSRTSGR